MSVLVIAEPGATAQGDVDTMLALAAVAKGADCDVWKPGYCSNPERMCERRHIGLDHPKRAYYQQAYSWLHWSEYALQEFRAICDSLGMKLALSVYLPEDVPTAATYADILKVSSFENQAADMRGAFCSFTETTQAIVSLGMRTITEARESMRHWPRSRTRFLHCTSSYPAPLSETNLAAIRGNRFSVQHGFLPPCDGLSDHSRDLDMGGFAVCAGAQIIETHYRLYDCDPENPDYPVAFDPGELATYVGKIRKAESAMGDGVKRITESEKAMLPYRVNA